MSSLIYALRTNSGFLAVNALLTFIMVPYATGPSVGSNTGELGDACLIKALFSPGIVLYQCIIQKKEKNKKQNKTKNNKKIHLFKILHNDK
ncbi:hypothetical protein LEMLEM_LOCUS8079 [Lemmus lemmus]